MENINCKEFFEEGEENEEAIFMIIPNLNDFNLSPTQFEELWEQKPEEHGKVRVFGKEFDMPRFCKSYGQNYYFSGKQHSAAPLLDIDILYDDEYKPFLCVCIEFLNEKYAENNWVFNQVLINWYNNNQHYISDHSDDESKFVKGSPIVCFNYCKHPRDIVIKRKKSDLKKKKSLKHLMENNTGYVMYGKDFQKNYTHGVPKRVTKERRDERRISITFRYFEKSE